MSEPFDPGRAATAVEAFCLADPDNPAAIRYKLARENLQAALDGLKATFRELGE